MSAHTLPLDIDKGLRNKFFSVDDPGASGTISIERGKGDVLCEIVTAGAESRVLPDATGLAPNYKITVVLKEDGGDLTITGAESSVVLEDAGDMAQFKVTDNNGTFVWRIVSTTPMAAVASSDVAVIFDAEAEDIAAATGGAISVATYYTTFDTDAGGDAFTLADGTVVGQMKKLQLIVDGGGDGVVTLTSAADENTITFADAGDVAVLRWNGSAWRIVELSNQADGVSAPVASTV